MSTSLTFILIGVVFAIAIWLSFKIREQSEENLKKLNLYIDRIEQNSDSSDVYEDCIEFVQKGGYIIPKELFRNTYSRFIEICDRNSYDHRAWKLLAILILKYNSDFSKSKEGRRCRLETFNCLSECLFREVNNTSVRDGIVAAILVLKGVRQHEAFYLYSRSLRLIEKHPRQTEFRILALELGRHHYSLSRSKKPTIYDELLVQNDINVRSG